MAQRDLLQKKFRIFIWLSSFVLIMEVVGGIFTNSLALMSDAGHVLIDLLALLLAYFAMRLTRRGTTKNFTFGYYRAEILAAVTNGVVLILLTLYIFYQSYLRFLSPQKINGPEMFAIAIIGLAANLYVVIKM
jgi:cobalt-zinc-cadmium efflux system protein